MTRGKIPVAQEIMTRNPVSVRPDDDIEVAVRLMFRRGYSGLPVVDSAERPVGVVSEHDCIRVIAEAIVDRWPIGRVDVHMTRALDVVDPREDVLALSDRFAKGKHRRLLVVEEERLVGLITRRDVLKTLHRMEQAIHHPRRKSTYEEIARRWGAEE